jgi:predicted esterase
MLSETAEIKTNPDHLKDKPVFIAHGTTDNVIRYNDGMAAAELLKKKGLSRIHFINYNMAHTISQDEIKDINAWLLKQMKMLSGK